MPLPIEIVLNLVPHSSPQLGDDQTIGEGHDEERKEEKSSVQTKVESTFQFEATPHFSAFVGCEQNEN